MSGEFDKLSKEESRWLGHQYEKIIGFGTDVYSRHNKVKQKKRDWIFKKYDALRKIGYSPETIYKFLREKIDQQQVEICDSYLRSCIRKKSGLKSFPRMAYYDFTDYLDFDIVRQAYTEYVESGQYFLDNSSKVKEVLTV